MKFTWKLGPAILVIAALALFVSACGDDKEKDEVGDAIEDFFSSATSGAIEGTRKSGDAPEPSGGPAVEVTGSGLSYYGMATAFTVTSATPLSKVIVFVDGADGWYEISLAAPATSVPVSLALEDETPEDEFSCMYAGVGADGKVGAYDEVFMVVTSAPQVESFLSGATSGAIQGLRREGQPPAPSGGPSLTSSGNTVVINGGTNRVVVSSATPLSKVLVFVGNVFGYYELTLPSPQTNVELLLTINQSIGVSSFNCIYAGVDAQGRVGSYDEVPTSVTNVGSGAIQVSLSWDTAADVDLHVVEPGGEEIYYGNRGSEAGGELDLDSNAGCSADNVRNENVTWRRTPPSGNYIVRVDYWSACGAGATNYVVTVIKGGSVQTFTGQFTGPGDGGGEGDGVTITNFTF